MPLLARVIATNIGLDYVKDRWAFQAEDGSEHAEAVTMCCAIKPLSSWLLEEVVSVTRERCGGQGYLSANRFGTFLGLAHAAMTADSGDLGLALEHAIAGSAETQNTIKKYQLQVRDAQVKVAAADAKVSADRKAAAMQTLRSPPTARPP